MRGLEHSRFAKFFPLDGNDPWSSDALFDHERRDERRDDNERRSSELRSDNGKHKPAPVSLGMPNAVALECEAVREEAAVQETRFGRIHYKSIGLI